MTKWAPGPAFQWLGIPVVLAMLANIGESYVWTREVGLAILWGLIYLVEVAVRRGGEKSVPVVSREDQYKARNLPPAF